MADFLSKYTGQEIDQLLTNVSQKINVTDIVDDKTIGDNVTPASSRLMKGAYALLDDIETFNSNKVLRIDGTSQSVKGKKTFEAATLFQTGLTVPENYFVNIISKATEGSHAVNLAMLQDHGLSQQDSAGVGIAISRLTTGYLKLDVDFSGVTGAPEGTVLDNIMVSSGKNSYGIPYNKFLEGAVNSEIFAKKVDKTTYDSKMSELDSSLSQRVLTSTYNIDIASINLAIGNRVLISTYNARMTSIDTSLANKVETSVYNAAISSLNSGKVDVSTYNNKMTALDASLATKMDYSKTSSVSSSASAVTTIGTFPKPLAMRLLAACTFTSDGSVSLYEIHVTGVAISSVVVLQGSNTTAVNFTAAGSGSNVVLSVNSTSAIKIDYKVIVNFV